VNRVVATQGLLRDDDGQQQTRHRGTVAQRFVELARMQKSHRRPNPENTLRRQELRGARHALIGVQIIAAVLAIAAIVRLRASPVMLIAIAASQVMAAGWLARRVKHARLVALVAALLPLAWGFGQILVLDVATWFQLSLLGVGALEALLIAGSTPRDPPKTPTPRDRPGRRY
jgi:hypothetical protein